MFLDFIQHSARHLLYWQKCHSLVTDKKKENMHTVCLCLDTGMVQRSYSLTHYRGFSVYLTTFLILWWLSKQNTIICVFTLTKKKLFNVLMKEISGLVISYYISMGLVMTRDYRTQTHAHTPAHKQQLRILLQCIQFSAIWGNTWKERQREKGGDSSESAFDCNWQKANFGDMEVGYMWVGCLICHWFAESAI